MKSLLLAFFLLGGCALQQPVEVVDAPRYGGEARFPCYNATGSGIFFWNIAQPTKELARTELKLLVGVWDGSLSLEKFVEGIVALNPDWRSIAETWVEMCAGDGIQGVEV